MRNTVVFPFALLLATMATGCSTVKSQALTREEAANIHSVTVVQNRGTEEYRTLIVANPAMAFGLIGGMIAAAETSAKSARLTQALDPTRTRLRERLATQLVEVLTHDVYEVETELRDTPKNAGDTKPATGDVLKKGNTDAVLSTTMSAGYVSVGPGMPYVPSVRVEVIATRVATGAVIYQNTFAYGYTVGESDRAVHLNADDRYRFDNIDALVDRADEARDGLIDGVNAIAERVAVDLRKN